MNKKKKVKTTLYINDYLYQRSKELALEVKGNATDVVNNALEFYFNHLDTPVAMQTKSGRVGLVNELRESGYRSGFGDGLKFQKWVRS